MISEYFLTFLQDYYKANGRSFLTRCSSVAVSLLRIHIIATAYEWQTFVDSGSNLLGVSIYFELKLISTYEKCTENCHAYQGKSSHNSAFFLYTCSYEYFFGGYIELCSRIYILDCISCDLFWSYRQFANKNSKQDATVCSSQTVGSDFGVHECMRKGRQLKRCIFAYLTVEYHLTDGFHAICRKSELRVLTWFCFFAPCCWKPAGMPHVPTVEESH